MAFYLSREEVQAIMAQHRKKQTLTAISAAMGRDLKTIRKVVAGQTDENAPVRRSRVSKLDSHKEYIAERWAQGCHNAQVLWEELRARGFTGSVSLVKQHVTPWRPQRGVAPRAGLKRPPANKPHVTGRIAGRWSIRTGGGSSIFSRTR